MFQVYFTNHGYYSTERFESISTALSYGKSKGFDFRVDQIWITGKANPICSWSIISGTRWHVDI